MTLTRQLLAGITAAFIVLLIGIEAIYLSLARSALESQLNAHANETATSLALTIGSRMQTLDAAFVNAIVNPVFDRGHFDLVEVKRGDGSQVFARRLEGSEIEVPAWFVGLASFDPPTGRAMISAGWRQLGQVSVRVHPKFAYRQLWETAIATLTWMGVLFALALAAMRVYLAGILKPLLKIEEAAVEIGNRNFVSIDFEPRARELRSVTGAINSLSAKIREAMQHEADNAERLRRDAFEDAATGRLNRRGLENALASALDKTAEVHSGALELFRLEGLDEVNAVAGLGKGDGLLKRLMEALAAPAQGVAPLTGRWQGPVLAAFLANVPPETAVAWADGIRQAFGASLKAEGLPKDVSVQAGVGHFTSGGATVAALGRLAEDALAQAVSQGGGAVSLSIDASGGQQADIRDEIVSALEQGRLSLLYQRVSSIPDGDLLQWELWSQLVDRRGEAVPARTYIPVASQLGLLPAVDGRVVELALDALARSRDMPIVAVNIASQSVLDEAFRTRLFALLKERGRDARRLVFEMTGASASKVPEATAAFARQLRRAGSRLALDNFELDRNAIALVNELMPAYVKLAPVFTKEISEREDARFILESMLRVFQPLEIPVIAQGVEDGGMVAILSELRLAGYQGYVLGRPAPLPG
jgi:EAL domain-containing protein (putative c-di-GMP-specific phosphodiesterase class I)/GGDEF domain-containing protein